ncbi:MAG: hypothetical protein K0S99_2952 [Thermomicrobiales bacterium]|nr:hypothetical protein [Thermomicrobiales bacterium]
MASASRKNVMERHATTCLIGALRILASRLHLDGETAKTRIRR